MKAQPYSDQTNWSNDYLTDPALIKLLGPFDTDPSCPVTMPWPTAKTMHHFGASDGLAAAWTGRVFMNPPYRGVVKWADKFAAHANGIALLNGRSTETRATQTILRAAAALWLPEGRLTFFKTNGEPWPQKWFPSLLIAMTAFDVERMQAASAHFGGVVLVNPKPQKFSRNAA